MKARGTPEKLLWILVIYLWEFSLFLWKKVLHIVFSVELDSIVTIIYHARLLFMFLESESIQKFPLLYNTVI